jgi:hypothetical protein
VDRPQRGIRDGHETRPTGKNLNVDCLTGFFARESLDSSHYFGPPYLGKDTVVLLPGLICNEHAHDADDCDPVCNDFESICNDCEPKPKTQLQSICAHPSDDCDPAHGCLQVVTDNNLPVELTALEKIIHAEHPSSLPPNPPKVSARGICSAFTGCT